MSRPVVDIRILPIRTGTLLTLAFFGAKIFGYITWSWWLVFAPLWLPPVIFFGCLAAFGVVASLFLLGVFVWEAFSYSKWRRRY